MTRSEESLVGYSVLSQKAGRTRKPVLLKAYLCIFVCYAVKAVHIELVTNLTVESFIAPLRKFVARRGKPNCMFSDHGTIFVAGNCQLKELFQFLQEKECKDQTVHFCYTQHIEWNFIPEEAPNFGGLWGDAPTYIQTFPRDAEQYAGLQLDFNF